MGHAGPGLERILVLEVARVTEAAAIAAAQLRGRGNEKAADKAAVDAMRRELGSVEINGTVVIGEGEMDEAPMLYIGEKVGTGDGPDVDIAVDPLEGTTICAKAMPNALAVLAISERGGLLHAPDMYMNKIAVGPGYPEGVVDLDATPLDNLTSLAKAKGVPIHEIMACILDRPRHAELIRAVREAGAGVQLIPDGDIAGVIWTTDPNETGIDIYMGSGGAPEGVLAAAALRCIGGQMQGRLMPLKDEERIAPRRWASATSPRSSSSRRWPLPTSFFLQPASPTVRCSRASESGAISPRPRRLSCARRPVPSGASNRLCATLARASSDICVPGALGCGPCLSLRRSGCESTYNLKDNRSAARSGGGSFAHGKFAAFESEGGAEQRPFLGVQ